MLKYTVLFVGFGFEGVGFSMKGGICVREEGVGAGHRARAGELGYGGGSQGVE